MTRFKLWWNKYVGVPHLHIWGNPQIKWLPDRSDYVIIYFCQDPNCDEWQ